LEAARPEEALAWVRKQGSIVQASIPEDDDDQDERAPAVQRASLEARILEALGRKDEAQDLRWHTFEAALSAPLLREYLKALPDFEDIEAEERASACALAHHDGLAALMFFLDWPRYDLAARLIVTRHDQWDGQNWHILPQVAELLQHEYPLAATILYRALLDDILARARSKAYPHGVKYLKQLDLLAPDTDANPSRPDDLDRHAVYRVALKQAHARKAGFWGLAGESAKGLDSGDDGRAVGRRPLWKAAD
jgi:hypothetical protein